MFNLLVKVGPWPNERDSFVAPRVFEGMDDALIDRFSRDGQPNLEALCSLPALFVQETNYNRGQQPARIGTINRARLVGREVILEYSYDSLVPPIPNDVLERFAAEFEIASWEFTRTHWTVKDVDLYRCILRHLSPERPRPTAFQLAQHVNIDASLVAVMMPFDAKFDGVYAALQTTANSLGLRCVRADDIWENHTVIQDVVSLIDRARVVICDCTDRNANVFYEMGIAHTLGRDVILIAQAEADIPFDVRHHRYLRYLNNAEGLAALSQRVQPRLTTLFGMAA